MKPNTFRSWQSRLGIKGKELAKKLDISETYLYKLMNGEKPITKNIIKRMEKLTKEHNARRTGTENLEDRIKVLIHYYVQNRFGSYFEPDSLMEERTKIIDGMYIAE